jgi:hypothetical protein
MQTLFEYHLATLTEIIVAIRDKKQFNLSFTEKDFPRNEIVIRHPHAFLAATSISWATHGMVVWSSGDHLSTRGFVNETVAGLTSKIAIDTHIKNILKIAKG